MQVHIQTFDSSVDNLSDMKFPVKIVDFMIYSIYGNNTNLGSEKLYHHPGVYINCLILDYMAESSLMGGWITE